MIHWMVFVRKTRLIALLALQGVLLASAAQAIESVEHGLVLPDGGKYFESSDSMGRAVKPAAKLSDSEPVTMEADAVGYDRENGIAVAAGNVTVVQGMYVLKADKLTYYQLQNLAVAEGNVSVLQPTGDVYFADSAQLKSDMQQGVIYAFQARMTDNSVFAAREARKVDAATTELKKAIYTPCNLCETAAPFWQVKASKMTVDDRAEEITYRNARMEIGGVPVFYTPYLSQPTPDAAARSGFLTPEYASSNNLGRSVKVPYYWRIDHDKDVTLTPWYMTDEGWLLEGDYRQLTDRGDYEMEFSATNPQKRDGLGNMTDGHEFRGHIYARGEEQIGDYSRLGFDINRTTDDTYIRRYGFGAQRVLFSEVYAERAEQRNFVMARALGIQGLRATDDPDTTPLVLPTLEGYYETRPYDSGLRLHAFGDAQSLSREIGADQNRLSTTLGATLPYVTEGGHVLTSTANLRQDYYQLDDVPVPGSPAFSGNKLRTVPQAALEWRYPLIKTMQSGDSVTLEPIALAVVQPNGGNPIEIPNEDNTLIELSDTNLFSIDRMPGLDTVDSGTRAAYGFRTRYLFTGGESLDGLFGQNYSFSDDTPFPNSTTPGQNVSDYIGRLGFDAAPVNLSYRFALDHSTLTANRSEVTLGFADTWLNLMATYRALNNNRYLRDSEEGTLYASVPVSDEWSIYGSGRRDMALDQMIAASAGVIYHNECFSLMLQGLRSYTRDRDIEPDTQITLRIGFKNLGEFGD